MEVYLLEEFNKTEFAWDKRTGGVVSRTSDYVCSEIILYSPELDTYFTSSTWSDELTESKRPWYYKECQMTYIGEL